MARIFNIRADLFIALLGMVLTVVIAVFQSDTFWDFFEGRVEINAYYEIQDNGQCGLAALQIDNRSRKNRKNIKINLIEDWISKRGDEKINFGTAKEMILTSAMSLPIPYREPLDVEYKGKSSTIYIPELAAGQYLDLFFGRDISSKMASARSKLGSDPEHWNKPRVALATSDQGEEKVISFGKCLDNPPSATEG